ncbi:MAG: hypothetical protein LBR95_00470 [Azoarcus sp.]|jgi:hypothetical protein|nr:hypothetical protein [Azoarcus sp.]
MPPAYALGRLKPGQMNKTEAEYALRQQAGEVLWYRFEGVKLRLAAVETRTGELT